VALGSAQLIANRPREAEASFRQDLKRYPHNGWALYGLAESLRRQNRRAEAQAIDAGMRSVWPASQPRPDARY
jgi:TolA-binding protein